MKLLALLAAAAGLAAAAAGCSQHIDGLSIPNPPTTLSSVPSSLVTLAPGLSSAQEHPVPGVTTTTAPKVTPGSDAIAGTVLGPQGPVGGATVQIDRFVDDKYASARTTTAADGSWSFDGILGGRYRVRAWKAPDLGMSTPQVLFVSSDEGQALLLQLTQFQGPQVQVAINPGVPTVGQPANLVVQVDNAAVNADGIETSPPEAGQSVTLVDGSSWQITGSNPGVTNASGQVLFQITCTAAGAAPLSAQVGSAAPVTLQMPACQA